jgi:hypothetical protein
MKRLENDLQRARAVGREPRVGELLSHLPHVRLPQHEQHVRSRLSRTGDPVPDRTNAAARRADSKGRGELLWIEVEGSAIGLGQDLPPVRELTVDRSNRPLGVGEREPDPLR